MKGLERKLSFLRGLATGFRPGNLTQAIIFITDQCNARCDFCFNSRLSHFKDSAIKDSSKPLRLDEYEKISRKMKPLFQVVLGGGEPFLNMDIEKIGKAFYSNAGVRLISIPTNGLLTSRIAKKMEWLTEHCPKARINLILSIDAMEDTHNEWRRIPGCFKKALKVGEKVLELKKKRDNINLVVNTLVKEKNLKEIVTLNKLLVNKYGRGNFYHNLQLDQRIEAAPEIKRNKDKIMNIFRTIYLANTKRMNITKRLVDYFYIETINKLILRQITTEKMSYKCLAGNKMCVILPDGNASACEPFIFEKGYESFFRPNIRDYDYDYLKVRKDPRFQKILTFINGNHCRLCSWSCSAAVSMVFYPRNWIILKNLI